MNIREKSKEKKKFKLKILIFLMNDQHKKFNIKFISLMNKAFFIFPIRDQ